VQTISNLPSTDLSNPEVVKAITNSLLSQPELKKKDPDIQKAVLNFAVKCDEKEIEDLAFEVINSLSTSNITDPKMHEAILNFATTLTKEQLIGDVLKLALTSISYLKSTLEVNQLTFPLFKKRKLKNPTALASRVIDHLKDTLKMQKSALIIAKKLPLRNIEELIKSTGEEAVNVILKYPNLEISADIILKFDPTLSSIKTPEDVLNFCFINKGKGCASIRRPGISDQLIKKFHPLLNKFFQEKPEKLTPNVAKELLKLPRYYPILSNNITQRIELLQGKKARISASTLERGAALVMPLDVLLTKMKGKNPHLFPHETIALRSILSQLEKLEKRRT
jgi:hypothetical protein